MVKVAFFFILMYGPRASLFQLQTSFPQRMLEIRQ